MRAALVAIATLHLACTAPDSAVLEAEPESGEPRGSQSEPRTPRPSAEARGPSPTARSGGPSVVPRAPASDLPTPVAFASGTVPPPVAKNRSGPLHTVQLSITGMT